METASSSHADLAATWLSAIAAAPPGAHQLVTHPGMDAEDMRAFIHAGLAPGQIARERAAEADALCDPRFLDGMAPAGASLARFSSLQPDAGRSRIE